MLSGPKAAYESGLRQRVFGIVDAPRQHAGATPRAYHLQHAERERRINTRS